MLYKDIVNDYSGHVKKENETKDSAVQEWGREIGSIRVGKKSVSYFSVPVYQIFFLLKLADENHKKFQWQTCYVANLSLCEILQTRSTSAGISAAGIPQQQRAPP